MKNKAAPHYLFAVFFLALFGAFPAISLAAPRIFYSDITSGPNSGGEGNQGAFVTIFGTGFGSTRGSSVVQIADTDVAVYKIWSDTKISFQPGASVPSGAGAIRVTVGGESSNTDVTFNVRPGDIYFVSRSGNDSTCLPNNVNSPCRNAQNVFNLAAFGPGDQIVLRGGTWTDTNARYGSFFSFQDGKGGTAADPIVLMAYPGERVLIQRTSGQKGIHAYNSPGGYTIAGLAIDMQGNSGTPFGYPPGAAANFGNLMQNIRAVNNEFTGMISPGGGSAAMEGRGRNIKYLGNYIHHNGIPANVSSGSATCPTPPGTCSSKLYHSIYFDNNDRTSTQDIEIAYNLIEHQGGGRGVQIYNSPNECAGSSQAGAGGTIFNVSVHHNVVHDIALDGILFSDCNYAGMVAYDNIVYRTAIRAYQTDGNTGASCMRFNDPHLVARAYNNTLYNCAVDGNSGSSAVNFQAATDVDFINNIVYSTGGNGYTVGAPATLIRTATNNLFFGAGAAPSWSTNSLSADPLFIGATTGNFLLNASSPSIDAGTSPSAPLSTDIHGRPRPQGTAHDVGAVETDGVILPSPTNVRITKR